MLAIASYLRKIIENLQFTVQIEISPKKTFFCPTPTYSGLCSSDYPYMKILFLVGFLGLGVIYSEKNISASLNLFERRDTHIQAYAAVSEQQNCSNSM